MPGGAGFWSAFDLIPCLDGKARRVGIRSQQVVDGFSGELAKAAPYMINPFFTIISETHGWIEEICPSLFHPVSHSRV
jgi:hypothetical protein